jgi:hypothetical protein
MGADSPKRARLCKRKRSEISKFDVKETEYLYVMKMPVFFDPDMKLNVRRRKLPHWTQEKVIYFVTFRLSDSLPVQKLEALNEEKTRWLAANLLPHNDRQIKEYHRNFSRRIHEWLDAGYGSCLLARPEICRVVDDTLNFFNGQRYALGEYMVMPNHVHVLLEPLGDHQLSEILHSWKSYSCGQSSIRVPRLDWTT